VADLLGPYYMDALHPAESDVVDRHLRECADCRSAAGEVCDVIAALALLDDANEPAVARPARSTAERNLLGNRRPAGRTALPGPAGRPRSRQQRIALMRASLALAVLLFAGFGTLFVVDQLTGDDRRSLVTVAVTASEPGTGASATVFASETESGVHLQVTVSGLRDGNAYQLITVTLDGQAHDVSRWTGRSTVQDISADAPGTLADLSFVTISMVGGPPAVMVDLRGHGRPAPR
jgi:hypothetical protein